MRKLLLAMIIGVGLSLSTAFAMEHSVTDVGLEFQNEEHAIVHFTFNNKTDGYHAEMYYIPKLTVIATYPESSFSYYEDYMYFEPVAFSIGAKESKALKYDCIFPKNLPKGSYSLNIHFYERTNKISYYSTNIQLGEIKSTIQNGTYNIMDFAEPAIVVDDVLYGSASGPKVSKDSRIQALLNLKLNGNTLKRVIPKFTIYERTLLGKKISTSVGNMIELEPNQEKEIFITLPFINIPESYLIHVALLDENSNQVSKTYEFRYVVTGAAANVTYLKVKTDLTVGAGIVGPADASVLMNSNVICNIYDLNQNLLDSQKEVATLSVIEKEFIFSLQDVVEDNKKVVVEVIVEHAGKVLTSKKNEIALDELEGKKIVFSDIVGTKYEEAVTLLNALGIINGYPDGTFRPENSITRAEFTVIANKLAKLKLEAMTGVFTDCELHWGQQYAETAAKNGIVSGYPDGTFRPDNPVTYQEGVTILLNMKGYKKEVNNSVAGWPYNYLNKAKDVGLLRSIDAETYSLPANRGDVAIMAMNAQRMTR